MFIWGALWLCEFENSQKLRILSLIHLGRICLECRRPGFDPWIERIPWRRAWQPIPVLLPGEFHGQRSLMGYSRWGRTEPYTTEWLTHELITAGGSLSTNGAYPFPIPIDQLHLPCTNTYDSDFSFLQCSIFSSSLSMSVSGQDFRLTETDETQVAAAKLLQSCPTLCDSIDSSTPGSPVPGIPQARTLEWVAISFSNAWKWKVKGKSLSRIRLLATPWTAAHQVPPSMVFSRQECWSRVALPYPNSYLFLFSCLFSSQPSIHF